MTMPVAIRSASHRRRTLDPGEDPLALQPYLLDLSTYDYTYTSPRESGREFYLATGGECHGIRIKCAAVSTISIRLWLVSTQANLASKAGVAVGVGENLLYFDAPVALTAGTLYRVSSYPSGGVYTARYRKSADHPDGAIVILTANCFCYLTGAGYPTTPVPSWASASEPIIYA